MKPFMTGILLVTVLSVSAYATYDYTITGGYFGALTLENSETLLMTGGGGDIITLEDNSSATIRGTSHLEEGFGGIWEIRLIGYSHLDFLGGELGTLNIGNDATATLAGGTIVQIWSQQIAWKYAGDPPVWVPNPHIEIIYSGALPTLQTIYGLPHLVGKWGNGDPFSIYLSAVPVRYGYSPAIDNIKFTLIPEPTSLLLLAVGGLLLKRR